MFSPSPTAGAGLVAPSPVHLIKRVMDTLCIFMNGTYKAEQVFDKFFIHECFMSLVFWHAAT
jgi:hypothetical protein